MYKPKVLLLFCGGTIAMMPDPETGALIPAKSPEDLFELVPELKASYRVDYEFITNVDSPNIQIAHWQHIVKTIEEKFAGYDGFVITHGTDMLAYTASALSFALRDVGKPVILTGSQLPPDHPTTDARHNLYNAFRLASMPVGEVVVCFGESVLRGNRSTKRSEKELDAFVSPKYPQLGRIWNEIDLVGFHRQKTGNPPVVRSDFETDVVAFTIHPAVEPRYFDALIDARVSGVVLTTVGTGNVPTEENSFVASIERATQKGIPVLLQTQLQAGSVYPGKYKTGMLAIEAGGISSGDMTLEATITKLMWVLGQTTAMDRIQELMQSDIAGEITVTS